MMKNIKMSQKLMNFILITVLIKYKFLLNRKNLFNNRKKTKINILILNNLKVSLNSKQQIKILFKPHNKKKLITTTLASLEDLIIFLISKIILQIIKKMLLKNLDNLIINLKISGHPDLIIPQTKIIIQNNKNNNLSLIILKLKLTC
jgi:hypothetical protein